MLTSSNEVFLFPGNPPPMFNKYIFMKPNSRASLKIPAEAAIALWKAVGSLHPEPTWKLTPTTDKPKSWANANNDGAWVRGSHPNLIPSGHCASVASQRIRITKLKKRNKILVLCLE